MQTEKHNTLMQQLLYSIWQVIMFNCIICQDEHFLNTNMHTG